MERPLTRNIRADGQPVSLREYEAAGGYQALRRALAIGPQAVQDLVTASNLRGRGGAGFPTGKKWSFVPMGLEARRPKYFVVNADEMEPGTMKDRLLLEGDPHQVLEGTILSAFAIGAEIAYIFLRWEYVEAGRRLCNALVEAERRGYVGQDILGSGYSLTMHLHASAGRYMCGEETGLLNALERNRATPRNKPPFPQTCGLWGKPTVINNVETVCNILHIINHGPEWFQGLGLGECAGTKIYGVSGRVKNPGLWELPMGTPLREILEQHAGGMKDGCRFRGLLPGGASTDFLVEEHLDIAMDFASVERAGSRLGTGTIVVLDDQTCPVGMVLCLETFFARESCGWCTPCREGLPWVARTLGALEAGEGQPGDLDVLRHHADTLKMGHTFCALAPGAMEPLASALKYFGRDFEAHVEQKRCPWRP